VPAHTKLSHSVFDRGPPAAANQGIPSNERAQFPFLALTEMSEGLWYLTQAFHLAPSGIQKSCKIPLEFLNFPIEVQVLGQMNPGAI
jgi:hypothetical protein